MNAPLLPDPAPDSVLPLHTVVAVFDPDGVEPSFAYTVGLGARPGRAYELITIGLPANGKIAHAVITSAAEQLVNDGLDPAEDLDLDEVLQNGYVVRLHRAGDTSRCTGARELHGPQVPVWQILTPDRWGLFPGERGYSGIPKAQPLL